jgi:hypothetical protein
MGKRAVTINKQSSRSNGTSARASNFVLHVAGSLLNVAVQITNKATSTTDHANRLSFARAIISSPVPIATSMTPAILTNATVAGEAGNVALSGSGTPVVDADVDFVVASMFNTFADRYVAQTNLGIPLQFGS